MIRVIEQADANKPKTIPVPINDDRDEAATHRAGKKDDLKKQSQYMPALMGVTSFAKGDYEDNSNGGAQENKANQSQLHTPTLTERAVIGTKSVGAAPV
jgi:hypothetical protein